MKNLQNISICLLFILFVVLGCSGSNSNSSAPSILSSENSSKPSNSAVPNQPKTYELDFPGQTDRIVDEGSDEDQIRKNIAEIDKSITYEQLKKNADKYAGKAWACKGKIMQIQEDGGRTTALIALDGWGNKNVQIAGNLTSDFVENNQVYVVGYLAGNYSYTSVANWELTIPGLAARAMLKPSEVAKYQAQSKKK